MIEIFKITSSNYRELVAESVTWSGARWKTPRKMEANIIARQGSQTFTVPNEGDTVLFKWKGKELFRGTVFSRQYPSANIIKIIAYDLVRYLSRNEDIYAFSNVTLTDVFKRICRDFGIPMGSVAATGYRFSKLLFVDDTPLIDMLIKGIRDTRAQTNRLYYVRAEKGKVNLERYPDPTTLQVLDTHSNIIDYTYQTSIEDTATQVKMRTVINEKVYTRTAVDSSGRSKFGRLQYVESVENDINLAQLQTRANTRLSQKKGVKHELSSVTVVGDPALVSAIPVQIEIDDIGLKKKMYIDSDTHTFTGDTHQASLNLVDRNFVPTGG